MARKTPTLPPLPPPGRAACWAEFAKWALGIPLAVLVALGLVWLAVWATGSGDMMWQATRDMGSVLFWVALIVLMYPALLVMWVAELRSALRAARDWAALPQAEQAAALAARAAAVPPVRQRKRK